MNISVEDLMRYMLNLFDNTAKNLSAEYDKLSQKDLELCDLDHYIENHKLRGGELAKVGKLRKELREERRQIKYDIAYLEIVKKFTDKYNNKLITGDIIQNLKEQEKLLKKQDNPTYRYRTNVLDRLEAKTNEDISDRPTEM
jgi:DNA repair exonuclease SbcCD ATPase subunit